VPVNNIFGDTLALTVHDKFHIVIETLRDLFTTVEVVQSMISGRSRRFNANI
jgi:hypothetical protein